MKQYKHPKVTRRKMSNSAKQAWLLRDRVMTEEQKVKIGESMKLVEIEKAIKVNHHWRIIDILVDGKICYEIGFCKSDKINELNNNGFSVVHLPYQELNNKNILVFGVS